MGAKRSLRLFLTVVLIVLALCFLGWFLRLIFEGEKPLIEVSPLPEYISGKQTFTLSARDMKRGLRSIEVFVRQEGKKTSVFEEIFPFKGFLNYEGVHSFDAEFFIDPSAIKLTQGRIDLEIYVRDHSRKNGGDGNFSVVEHTMVVDTIPPAIAPVSRMHNINLGGQDSSFTEHLRILLKAVLWSTPIFSEAFRPRVRFNKVFISATSLSLTTLKRILRFTLRRRIRRVMSQNQGSIVTSAESGFGQIGSISPVGS